MPNKSARRFARKGRHSVLGWLSQLDAEIMIELLAAQDRAGLGGACAETGVHHGKSFILLALANPGTKNYAIDLFGRQDLNLDASGSGNIARFRANLRVFGIDEGNVVIDARKTLDVSPEDISAAVGLVRLFHVDGGHHKAVVQNDLALAEATIAPHGIVVIDDVFRPEWPEVSSGLFEYLAAGSGLVPFAIGFNKTFLCRHEIAKTCREDLLKVDFLKAFLARRYKVDAEELLVFQKYPLPEWRFAKWIWHYLGTVHPELAYALFKIRRRLKAR